MKTKSLLLPMIVSITFAFFSCEEQVTPITSEPTPEDSTVVIIIDKTVNITDDITVSTIWESGTAYVIDGTIRVGSSENVVLTIEPGTIIKFTKNSALEFAYFSGTFASINALGTALKPILFSANSTDTWKYISFYAGASDCQFSHCTFSEGGSSD